MRKYLQKTDKGLLFKIYKEILCFSKKEMIKDTLPRGVDKHMKRYCNK